MAKKKLATAPNHTDGKSKIALGVELIEEWESKRKNTRSSQGLLAELQARHPDRTWTINDVTNAKGKIKSKGSNNGRKKPQAQKEPKPTSPAPRGQQAGAVTAADLLAVKKGIGAAEVGSFAASVEQVGRLAEEVGGLDKLRQTVQALTAILGEE